MSWWTRVSAAPSDLVRYGDDVGGRSRSLRFYSHAASWIVHRRGTRRDHECLPKHYDIELWQYLSPSATSNHNTKISTAPAMDMLNNAVQFSRKMCINDVSKNSILWYSDIPCYHREKPELNNNHYQVTLSKWLVHDWILTDWCQKLTQWWALVEKLHLVLTEALAQLQTASLDTETIVTLNQKNNWICTRSKHAVIFQFHSTPTIR